MPYGRACGYYRRRVGRLSRGYGYRKRRTTYRRRSYGRRRFGRYAGRRRFRGRRIGNFGNKVFTFKFHWKDPAGITVQSNQVVDITAAKYFTLADIPNYTTYTGLFDSYKLCFVKMTLVPDLMHPPNCNDIVTSSAGHNMAKLNWYWVYDEDDANIPTSIGQILSNPNAHTSNLMAKPHKMCCRPKFAQTLYEGVVGAGYKPGRGWVDCADQGVQHFGFKYGINQIDWAGTAAAYTMNIPVYYTYYVKFKGWGRTN